MSLSLAARRAPQLVRMVNRGAMSRRIRPSLFSITCHQTRPFANDTASTVPSPKPSNEVIRDSAQEAKDPSEPQDDMSVARDQSIQPSNTSTRAKKSDNCSTGNFGSIHPQQRPPGRPHSLWRLLRLGETSLRFVDYGYQVVKFCVRFFDEFSDEGDDDE